MKRKGDVHTGGHNGGPIPSEEELTYQVRVYLSEEFAKVARENPDDPKLEPLMKIVREHDGRIKHQKMAFADFVPQFKADEEPEHRMAIEAALSAVDEADDDGDIDTTLAALEEYRDAVVGYIRRYSALYLWTRDTLQREGIDGQYAKRFAIYAEGGQETYSKETADALEEKLKPLVEDGTVIQISRIDSDPRNNPQAPKKFQII